MAYIYDIADTWNASGTTFTAIKMNVTDTASAAGSLLMDLQVGGVSQFNVTKGAAGVVFGQGSAVGRTRLSLPQFSEIVVPSGRLGISTGSNITHYFDGGLIIPANLKFGFSPSVNSTGFSSDTDVSLHRDAANTLAQRNGVNAQAFNLYNTYTDASNYERGFMRWVSNALQIGTDRLGTGSTRSLVLQTNGATRLTIGPTGTPEFTLAGALYINGQVGIAPVSAGVMRLINYNADGFSTLQLGLATTGFPALKVSTSTLQVRLGNDSAFTNIQGKLTTDTAYTAGMLVPTGYIVLFDSNGTAYKVPAEAL